ncbi:polysaccharide biosynthesis/export family protein [Novosphingobium bradum]|uniref:Polysaccharide biosynthesis/export family protein n=1 Tax=Novosphingobium bradum TaxID=1737444 RepID=A0ABV7IUJ4_9SPHN
MGALLVATLSGCATSGPSPFPTGGAAYGVVPEKAVPDAAADTIRPGDRLAIRVFGEPELSADNYVVDARGYIQVPLLGEVIAMQQSPRALAVEIERRLQARYVKDASVTVSLMDRTQATFAVEGDVNQPGVYPAHPGSTLLSAMAMARSPTKSAQLSEVIVLRRINGERAGARFNLVDIRRGRAADPQILAGDTVVVTNAAIKSAWRDFLQSTPVFNIFYLIK